MLLLPGEVSAVQPAPRDHYRADLQALDNAGVSSEEEDLWKS